jgi:hypothetical protein
MSVSDQQMRRLLPVIRDRIADGNLFQNGMYSRAELAEIINAAISAADQLRRATLVRPKAAWSPSDGPVLWWQLPVAEAPYLGTPNDHLWDNVYTHWTPLPIPTI